MTDILQLVQASSFLPTSAQIRARKKYWDKNGGLELEPDATLEEALQYAPSRSVEKHLRDNWARPGFAEWFLTPQFSLFESERLLHTAMQEIQQILMDPEAPSDRRINAAKEARAIHQLMLEQSGSKQKYADDVVAEMTPEQLREFIRRNSVAK